MSVYAWLDVGVHSFGHKIHLREAIVTSVSTIMITPTHQTDIIFYLVRPYLPIYEFSWSTEEKRKKNIYDFIYEHGVRLLPHTLRVYSSVS